MLRLKIADVVFDAEVNFKRTLAVCKNFVYDGEEKSEFTAKITKEDIDYERDSMQDDTTFSNAYLEGLALFRKLCDYLLDKGDGMIFHCSALAVDNKAYLFTAPSGTGKSTHARLWREYLGDKVVMINDDKPIIRFIGDKAYVYGTPWQGKHNLGVNGRAEIEAVIEVKRAKENSVIEIPKEKMIVTVLNQTLRPKEADRMMNVLALTDKLLRGVKTYRLYCNTDIDAARVCYNAVKKGDKNEN